MTRVIINQLVLFFVRIYMCWQQNTLGGLSSNIFASRCTYYIPDKEQLIAEVEKAIEEVEAEMEMKQADEPDTESGE